MSKAVELFQTAEESFRAQQLKSHVALNSRFHVVEIFANIPSRGEMQGITWEKC